jgi:hypothetical protein
MSGVLALALKRKALSRGTVPSAVPMGHALDSGTNGTVGTIGTVGTGGTISTALSDCDPVDMDAVEERAAMAADSVRVLPQRLGATAVPPAFVGR